jgi:hypothetical protein
LIDEAVAKPTWKRLVAAERDAALAQIANHPATGEAVDANRRNQQSRRDAPAGDRVCVFPSLERARSLFCLL